MPRGRHFPGGRQSLTPSGRRDRGSTMTTPSRAAALVTSLLLLSGLSPAFGQEAPRPVTHLPPRRLRLQGAVAACCAMPIIPCTRTPSRARRPCPVMTSCAAGSAAGRPTSRRRLSRPPPSRSQSPRRRSGISGPQNPRRRRARRCAETKAGRMLALPPTFSATIDGRRPAMPRAVQCPRSTKH